MTDISINTEHDGHIDFSKLEKLYEINKNWNQYRQVVSMYENTRKYILMLQQTLDFLKIKFDYYESKSKYNIKKLKVSEVDNNEFATITFVSKLDICECLMLSHIKEMYNKEHELAVQQFEIEKNIQMLKQQCKTLI
jgi:KaiC/GvpD/RAD55 family RecA-like ATPase